MNTVSADQTQIYFSCTFYEFRE